MKLSAPNSWQIADIGEIAQIISGGTPPSRESDCFAPPKSAIPWITPADLSGYKNKFISHGARDLTEKGLNSCSARLMPKGSVLFSSRAPIGYVAIAENQISTNQGFKSFVYPQDRDNGFAYYQLRYITPEAEARATGTTFKELSGSAAAKLPFLVAPKEEQRRIADKLDTTLARVDALNDRLARITPLLKRFRQSVLAAAYTGKLTQEFRAIEKFKSVDETLSEISPIPRPNRYNSRTEAIIAGDYALSVNDAKMKIPEAWKWVPLVDVARMESGHTPSRSVEAYWGGGIPWIGIADARENHAGTILDTIQKTTEEGIKNSAARILPKGTLCVSRTASVGYVVKMGKPMATSQDFVNWTCSEAINPDWLKWLFVAEGEALPRFGNGSTHTTIYFPEWLSLQVALPPVQEQNEIVRRVETLFAFADRLEARLQSAQTAAERLTPALLAKAFRGELVPQDPNDEPATELLRRLREARVAQTPPKPKRGRKAAATESALQNSKTRTSIGLALFPS